MLAFRRLGRGVSWTLRRPFYVYLAAAVVGAAFVAAAAGSWKLELPQAARDLTVAEYAYLLAGPAIPVDPDIVDYAQANVLPDADTWGIATNSVWLSSTVRRIIPYFYYVGINCAADPETLAGVYPIIVFFTPMADEANFHLLGEEEVAVVMLASGPAMGPVIQLNERMVVGDGTDMRVLLSTVVHENVHGQGGNFTFSGQCPGVDFKCWQDESSELESNTQTATLEVLASWCNHQNDLACKTFWYEIGNAASSSFHVWTWEHNLGWLYDFVDKTFWMSGGQAVQYDASMRYWAQNNPERLKAIVTNYGKMVWDKTLLGVVGGQKMHTGNFGLVEATPTALFFQETLMTFDDVGYQLGNLVILFLRLLS